MNGDIDSFFGDGDTDTLTGVEIADRLSEAERHLATFVLTGGEIPERFNRNIARSVLRQLAGTTELQDEGVIERFGLINQCLSGVALSVLTIKDDSEGTLVKPRKIRTQVSTKDAFRPDNGACTGTDPEIFYPIRGESSREAKEICAQCNAQDACLNHALVNNERFGIWGGTSERDRRRLKRSMVLPKKH